MNRFLEWLRTRPLNQSRSAESPARYFSVNEVKSRNKNVPDCPIETSFNAVAPDCPPIPVAGKDDPKDYTYQCEDTISQRQLYALNDSVDDAAKIGQSNPYNNSSYDTSKFWRSIARK